MQDLVNNTWQENSDQFQKIKKRALFRGASNFGISTKSNKKYYVVYENKEIHFGDINYEDYTIHKNKRRRTNYKLRHKKITLKSGKYAYKDKTQPAYWSFWTIW